MSFGFKFLSRNFSFDWLCVAINTGASSFFDQGIAMKISLFAAVTIALATSTGLQTANASVIDWTAWNPKQLNLT